MLFILNVGKWYAESISDAQRTSLYNSNSWKSTHTHTNIQETEIDGEQRLDTRNKTIVVDNDDNFFVRTQQAQFTHIQMRSVSWCVCGSVGSQTTTEPDVRCCFTIHNPLYWHPFGLASPKKSLLLPKCNELLCWLNEGVCGEGKEGGGLLGVGEGSPRLNRKQSTNTQHFQTIRCEGVMFSDLSWRMAVNTGVLDR